MFLYLLLLDNSRNTYSRHLKFGMVIVILFTSPNKQYYVILVVKLLMMFLYMLLLNNSRNTYSRHLKFVMVIVIHVIYKSK